MRATAYGLTFELPFACPALPPPDLDSKIDVTVVSGHVPRSLETAAIRTPGFDANPGCFLYRGGPRVGRFLVEDGKRVTYFRNPGGDDEIIAFHFLHSVMAALLHQRGHLILHASAVLLDDGVVILSGESGTGKSTVLAALAARGYPMLNDDLTVVRLRPDGEAEIVPGPSWVHLCQDAATRLLPKATECHHQPWHRMKVAVRVVGGISTAAQPFGRWATLAVHCGEELRTRRLGGRASFESLQECIFVPMFAAEHGERFSLMRAVLGGFNVLRIERPAGRWMVDEIVEAVLHG